MFFLFSNKSCIFATERYKFNIKKEIKWDF